MEDLDLLRSRAAAIDPERRQWHTWDRGIGYEVHIGTDCKDVKITAETPTPWERCDEVNDEFRETFAKAEAEYVAAIDPATAIELIDRLKNAEAALARIKALHSPNALGDCRECITASSDPYDMDWHTVEWPCQTIDALGLTEDPT